MKKKWLIMLLLFSMGISVSAITFDDSEPANNYWRSPLNWDLDRVPNSADTVIVDGNDVYGYDFCEINNPNFGGAGDGQCGILRIMGDGRLDMTGGKLVCSGANVQVGHTNPADAVFNFSGGVFEMANPALLQIGIQGGTIGTMNMSGDAVLTGLRSHLYLGQLGASNGSLTMSGNSEIIMGGGLFYSGYSGTGNATLNDNANLYIPTTAQLGFGIGSTGTITVNGGNFLANGNIIIGNRGTGTLNINGGTVGCNVGQCGLGWNANTVGAINMTDGVLNCGQYLMVSRSGKDCVLDMTGGTINVNLDLAIPFMATAGTGNIVKLHGGTINAANVTIRDGKGRLDLQEGKLIVPGNKEDYLWDMVDAGLITAYDGANPERANIFTEYNGYSDETTLWAYRPELDMAWNEYPATNGNLPGEEVDSVILTWSAGDGATDHEVFFGTSEAEMTTRGLTGGITQYDIPEMLALGQVYYWRVDEINAGGTTTGDVWTFTVESSVALDDFEAYDTNDAGYTEITTVWSASGDASLAISASVVNSGDISMKISGGGSAGSASRNVPFADLTMGGMAESLSVFFHGVGEGVTQNITVTLEDNSSNTKTVAYDGSSNDIQAWSYEPFVEMALALDVFSPVDVTDVKKITIGIPDTSNPVYIDDIGLYIPHCVSAKGPSGDLDGDCDVDLADYYFLAKEWLLSGSTYPWVDFEGYANEGALLVDWVTNPWATASGTTIALLPTDGMNSSQALRWGYNMSTSGTWTEIIGDITDVNLSQYDEFRIWIRTQPGNSQEQMLYVKFYQDQIDEDHLAAAGFYANPATTSAHPGEWTEMVVDLHSLVYTGGVSGNYSNLDELDNVVGILLGSCCGGAGNQGTIDFDNASLNAYYAEKSDINGDGIADIDDLADMASDWAGEILFP